MLKPVGILCFLTVIAMSNSMAADATPNPTITQIQSMLAKPDVLCGRFDQIKQLVGMKKPLASNGRFCVVKGKGIIWRTLKPFPNTLRLTRDEIVNYQGDRVAMRLDAKQEPTVRMINNVLFSLMAGDLAQLNDLFNVDGDVNKSHWHVSLTARQPALAKAIGTINLDGGTHVNTITMHDASGDKTTIDFSAIQTGASAMLPEEAVLIP